MAHGIAHAGIEHGRNRDLHRLLQEITLRRFRHQLDQGVAAVAGLAALLISARPCLRGEVDLLESYIEATALARTTTQNCTIAGSQVPNNTYGWGAIRAVLPGPEICPALFFDGFESGDTSGWSLLASGLTSGL